MKSLKQVLFEKYGGFADKRIKSLNKSNIFIADDRTPGDVGADHKLLSYFCTIFINTQSATQPISQTQALQIAASLAQHSLHPVSRALVAAASSTELVSVVNVKALPGLGLEGKLAHPVAFDCAGLLRLGSARFCDVDDLLGSPSGDSCRNAWQFGSQL